MQIKEQTFYKILQNGTKIVLRRCDSPVVYVGIMVGAGTRDEQPNENGMAHYIEHCVFKGCETKTKRGATQTKTMTARQIIMRIEGVGGEVNAYTTKEETTYYAAVPVGHWRQALHTILDMVNHATFPKHETDKEVNVILDEIESYNDSPSELIFDDFEAALFEGSSLEQPILGTKKSLRRISRSAENPKRWMQEHYRADRCVVFASGRITIDQLEKEVRK